MGVQHTDWGYHGGRKLSQHGNLGGVGFHVMDDPELAPQYFEMVREIVERYQNDERIIIWNVYNEIGNSKRGELSRPHLQKILEIVRGIDPIQPVTCETWSLQKGGLDSIPAIERYALEQSDIISYHSYGDYITNVKIIKTLQSFGRPIMVTEWLARGCRNTVQELFPLFYLEKIGAYNWGFVAGKYQTYEPWNNVWENYEKDPHFDYDFTKWFHDLYRPNHRPYDPKEIEIIRYFCDLADKDFAETQKQ